jgi:ADP-ribosylglycohydrolase
LGIIECRAPGNSVIEEITLASNSTDKRTDQPTVLDCLYGQAVGDALGVPFEFCTRDSFTCTGMVGHGSHDMPAGTWSDDTSMALVLCDSYRELGHIDCADIRRRFENWLFEGAYTVDGTFDVGGATMRALKSGYGQDGERDNGNGSLMRTVPLAFTDASDDEVRAVSAITHAHETSTEACVRMVRIARKLVAGEAPEDAILDSLELRARPRDQIRSGGYVLDTYDAALWCLLTTESYAGCVLEAVNLGSDTDTTAAVAGALAGIVYGRGAIPTSWLETLRGKDLIERCAF